MPTKIANSLSSLTICLVLFCKSFTSQWLPLLFVIVVCIRFQIISNEWDTHFVAISSTKRFNWAHSINRLHWRWKSRSKILHKAKTYRWHRSHLNSNHAIWKRFAKRSTKPVWPYHTTVKPILDIDSWVKVMVSNWIIYTVKVLIESSETFVLCSEFLF